MTSPIGQRRANIWSEANEGANPWGGTFHVEWLRLYDLPFQKTVHLKNPLNAFKPVKISRDCQVNISGISLLCKFFRIRKLGYAQISATDSQMHVLSAHCRLVFGSISIIRSESVQLVLSPLAKIGYHCRSSRKLLVKRCAL